MKNATGQTLTTEERMRVLESFGAQGVVLQELLAYNRNTFQRLPEFTNTAYPLPDEAFASAWDEYLRRAQDLGTVAVLKTCLRHLNFPIQQGISQDPTYRAVVMRGEPARDCALATGLPLLEPEGIELRMQATAAGRIPIVSVNNRADFEHILQALLNRNEPMDIPQSMGAVMVAGYNNWERIDQHKRHWQRSAPPDTWDHEFKRLIPQKALHQDRFIVVSTGAYSNVQAVDLDLGDDEWRRLSVDIRIVHECTHYAMKRIYGQMRNNLQDEIIADAMGLVSATGTFCSDWFLRFMGLENHRAPRPDGRVNVYRGDPPVSEAAFQILQTMLVQAARNIEALFPPGSDVQAACACIMGELATSTLESLSGPRRP
nr:hypothetical protein [uncultured Rhodoferax sp.]